MTKTGNDFAPDSGGFLDGVDGAITSACFEIAGGKYADQVLLGGGNAKPPVVLTLTIKSPDIDKDVNQSYSVGSQELWDIVDNGKAIVNTNPDKHSFRQGSMAWRLMEAMILSVGDGDMDKGQEYFVKKDLYMTEAAIYTGNYHWEVNPIENKIGDKVVISKPPLPVKYLGESETSASSAEPADTSNLDDILIENATGKSEKELKSFAIRNKDIKENDAYVKSIINSKKLKALEDAGTLMKDPDTDKYL